MKSDSESYNNAGSKSVKQVDAINITNDIHKLPLTGEPNSVTKNYKNGKLDSERYYDENGNVYLDIDYTDHGNRKTHPHVPHEHKYKNGIRQDEEEINK
ncbi:MAG: hypothetical protein IJ593_09440 [Lachnospiraceae bacterium]|nr:hypothetical protein [Lachnospiraceae bacterium]